MLGPAARYLVLVALILLPLSCARIPEYEAGGEELAVETLPEDSVPSEWGRLISVTNHRALPEHEFQLWFQDEGGNVRMVVYSTVALRLRTRARLIPRK